MNEKTALLFRISSFLLSVPITYVSSVEAYPQSIAAVPHAPSYIIGVCSLAGKRLSLIDTGKLLGVGIEWHSPLIVIVGKVGLVVEQVVGVESLSKCIPTTLLKLSSFEIRAEILAKFLFQTLVSLHSIHLFTFFISYNLFITIS